MIYIFYLFLDVLSGFRVTIHHFLDILAAFSCPFTQPNLTTLFGQPPTIYMTLTMYRPKMVALTRIL